MKKISLAIAAVVVLSTFTLTAAAQNRVLGRANVPFSFAAHDQRFDAGTYELRQIGAQIVRLQDVASGRGVTLMSPQAIGESSVTSLTFRSYGTRAFLAAVNAQSYHIAVGKSAAEQDVEASLAKTKTIALKLQH